MLKQSTPVSIKSKWRAIGITSAIPLVAAICNPFGILGGLGATIVLCISGLYSLSIGIFIISSLVTGRAGQFVTEHTIINSADFDVSELQAKTEKELQCLIQVALLSEEYERADEISKLLLLKVSASDSD